MNPPKIAIVVPCYNEDAILGSSLSKLHATLTELVKQTKVDKDSYILCVDDGSRDKTWNIIMEHSSQNIHGIKLAHNTGHQNALSAGLLWVKDKCDAAISIDADLQDDVSVIPKFVEKYMEGNGVVYGVRKGRPKDSFFKKTTARFFYKLIKTMGVEIIADHADFRLTGNKVLEAFGQFSEINLFLRGIFPLIGFRSTIVYYDRKERSAGQSKYPLKKMLSFALDGITSFSTKPLRIITMIGFLIFLASVIASIWVLVEKIFNNTTHGWASIVLPIYFIGGIQLLCLGIIGEYIGKIYRETKRRPRFIIEEEF